MEILSPDRYEEYDAFVRSRPLGSFMQAPAWADVKANWGHDIVVSRDKDGGIQGGMLILSRRAGPGTLLYAPRGPVCDYENGAVLADLLAGARQVAKNRGGILLKMDPFVEEGQEQAVDTFRAAGCRITLNAPFHDTIQPRHNYMLTGLAGVTPEKLLAGFTAHTRYYIRFAAKNGVVCKNTGLAGMDDFYALYGETGRRQHFTVRSRAYLENFLRAFPDDARLYMCYWQGQPLCGGISVRYGNRVSHVYGCSSDVQRRLCPTYLLQWEMMNWALEGGCDIYDMQGIATDPADSEELYNVYGFKKKFSGRVVTTAGEFEVIYRPMLNNALNTALRLRGALRRRRKAGAGPKGQAGEKTAETPAEN